MSLRPIMAAAMLAQDAADLVASTALLDEALDLFVRRGSRRGRAWTLVWLARPTVLADGPADEASAARARLEESLSLFRDAQDSPGIAWSLAFLASLDMAAGDGDRGRREAEEALAVATDAGVAQPQGEALRLLGVAALNDGDWVAARRLLDEAAAIHRSGGDRWQETIAVAQAAVAAALDGDDPDALERFARAADLADELASADPLAILLHSVVLFLWRLGRWEAAAELLGAYDAIRPHWWRRAGFAEVAEHVTRSPALDAARCAGGRLTHAEVIARVRALIDEERERSSPTEAAARHEVTDPP